MQLTKCKNCTEVSICEHKDLKLNLEHNGMIIYCNLVPEEPDEDFDSMMKEIPGFGR